MGEGEKGQFVQKGFQSMLLSVQWGTLCVNLISFTALLQLAQSCTRYSPLKQWKERGRKLSNLFSKLFSC